jgi:secondary thiamine-phosphate synthase enzyme
MNLMHTLSVRTTSRMEMADITARIQELVRASGMEAGVCHLFVAHTTAGLTINENADPHVQADILMVLNKIISDREAYRHLEGNSPAHLKASLMGPQLTVLVEQGRLVLGTWQGIFLCEFDGPRTRKVHIKMMAG